MTDVFMETRHQRYGYWYVYEFILKFSAGGKHIFILIYSTHVIFFAGKLFPFQVIKG